MVINQLDSKTIAWLRFPLAVAVVFIHNWGQPSDIEYSQLHTLPVTGMDLYNYIRICFSHVITHAAVPIFYLFSGYLYFVNGGGHYINRIKKKTTTLFIPYILWNIIALICIVMFMLGGIIIKGNQFDNILHLFEENGWCKLFWNYNQWGFDKTNWLGFMQPVNSGPINLPLWFLRDLFIVVLLTPLIELLLKYCRQYGVYILALCYISRCWFDIPGFSITALFFFTAGAYLSLNGKSLTTEFSRIKYWLYTISFILFIVMMWYDGSNTTFGNNLYSLFVLSMVVSVINISSTLIQKEKVSINKWLSNSSFFIFAFHTILIVPKTIGFICGFITTDDNPFIMIAKYFTTGILTVILSLLVYKFMQKHMPKTLRILMGNR